MTHTHARIRTRMLIGRERCARVLWPQHPTGCLSVLRASYPKTSNYSALLTQKKTKNLLKYDGQLTGGSHALFPTGAVRALRFGGRSERTSRQGRLRRPAPGSAPATSGQWCSWRWQSA